MSERGRPEHAEAIGLEQHCVEPGHWRIEGYEVIRHRDYWQIWQFERHLKSARTLAEARDWIWEHK